MPAQSPSAGTSTLKLIPVWRADWLRLVGGAILATGAIAVYSRTFSVPLIFDDNPAIVGNSTIRHWSTAFWPPSNSTASGRPILNLSLAINYAISGTAVWSYHALNLAIHVLSGLTLFGIVRRTLVPRAGQAAALIAFSAALLWTLHPLQTESVTYLVQRAESLMGLFYLLTLYGFIRGAEADGRPRRRWFALSVAACLLGMATKEVMVTAPLIVLLYDRTFVAGSFREAGRRRGGVHVALAATWLLLASLVASAGWDRNGTSGFDVGITPWAYWLTQFEAVTRYLWLSVWPHPLVFEYGTFWVNRPMEVALYALVVVGLAVAVLVALWRRPVPGFLGAWFFVILAPTSVMPGRIQMIVEHRMYLPLAAVMTLVAMGIHAAVRRQSWVVLAVLALGLGMLTARRNEDYRSELTIWSDTVAKRPNNELAHNSLGVAWSKIPGRRNDAIAQYEEALRLQPDDADAHNNLGVAWSQIPGRRSDAAAQFAEAVRLKPDYAEAHSNLGLAWSRMPGRLHDAIAQYEEALRLQPDYAVAHNNLGLAWSQIPGRLKDAAAQFAEAVRLQPDYAAAHNNLGLTWAQMPGRLNDAIAQYEEALRLQPDSAEAHYNLGNAWSQMPGRLNDAISEYKATLRLKPDFAPGWHNLGTIWFQMGNLPAAAAAFREEVRLSPNDPAARQALAAALPPAKDQ
jgi:tetratricopeptide (TPR) repeat protein